MSEAVKVFPVELRDLESLLRKRLGKELVVVNFSTEPLLPPGENYGSTILRVEATIKRNDRSCSQEGEDEEEKLNLVAKMLPNTDFQRRMFDSPFTFKKEIFLYEQLIPSYQQLERELIDGLTAERTFDVLPEFYGARLSLTSGGDTEIDDDAVILMQNLKAKGYYMADRRNGMDFEHGKVALAAMARFHALGMAMKRHKPDWFEVIKQRSKCLKIEGDNFADCINSLLLMIREDSVMSAHYDRLEAAMRQDSATSWTALPIEPWSTIVHADFWINNIMFRKDPLTGRVSDVKFVDFQNYLFMSPLRELVFFLATNFEAKAMEDRFDELLDFYYETFVGVLGSMRCDTVPFTREKFDAQLKIDAFEEFPHCPFMIKIMTAEVERDAKSGDVRDRMMDMTFNEVGLDRLRRCVKKFAEKGWLSE